MNAERLPPVLSACYFKAEAGTPCKTTAYHDPSRAGLTDLRRPAPPRAGQRGSLWVVPSLSCETLAKPPRADPKAGNIVVGGCAVIPPVGFHVGPVWATLEAAGQNHR